MSPRIFSGAMSLALAASGCSGSSDSQSESGQGGIAATGGRTSTTSSTVSRGGRLQDSGQGGSQPGGNSTRATNTGGTAPTVSVAGNTTIGGQNSSTVHVGGRNGSQISGGAGNPGTSLAGLGGLAIGGKAAGGRNSGGTAPGTGTTGGVAAGGKSSSAHAGSSIGGRAVGGSSHGATTSNAAGTGGTAGTAGTQAQLVLPEANAPFDYQIGGAYTPPTGVRVVSRDRNSAPAVGLYNICYINGYQIQPDEESFWSSQHPTLILKDGSGNPVVDEGWGETLLDTSTATKRSELANVIGGWIAKCKADGFNAVEVDNLDSYSRSNGLLTQANNVAFMALLSSTAHSNGLAIAQKNSSELLGSVATMGTDFAVVEECNRWDECDQYQAVYGDRIFIIEYRTQDFQKGCSAYPELSIVLRDLNVSTPGSSSYVYQGC